MIVVTGQLSIDDALALVLARVQPLDAEDVPLRLAAGRVLRRVWPRRDRPAAVRQLGDGWLRRARRRHARTPVGDRPVCCRSPVFRDASGARGRRHLDRRCRPAGCRRDRAGRGNEPRRWQRRRRGCEAGCPSAAARRGRAGGRGGRSGRRAPPSSGARRVGRRRDCEHQGFPPSARGCARNRDRAAAAGLAVGTGRDLRGQHAAAHRPARRRGRRCRACWRRLPTTPRRPPLRSRPGSTADVLVTSGGVSVGPHDLVRAGLAELGVEEVFWRVAVRPGRPIAFGVRGRTLVFGLPGNPVSSLVGCELFVRPAVLALQGVAEPGPSFMPGSSAPRSAATRDVLSCSAPGCGSNRTGSSSNRCAARSRT